MKIGLFGGSFDPIHDGHLATVRAARRELGLDKVLFLPTAVALNAGRVITQSYFDLRIR